MPAMERVTRRRFGALALTGLGAWRALSAGAAQADALVGPTGPASMSILYALRLVDDPDTDSIYAHLQADPDSDVVGSIPYDTPVLVLGQADGAKLWYGGTTWYKVALTYGTGWVYAPLLDDTPDGPPQPPLPLPVPEPVVVPSPVGAGRSIVVSLHEQFLWAFDGNAVALAVGCTTGGVGLETPPGDFAVEKHTRDYLFNSPWPKGSPDWYPSEQASYALLFHQPGYFLHDAPWRRVFGPDSQGGKGPLGKDHTGSHGCINLPYPAAQFLYAWAPDDTPVRIL